MASMKLSIPPEGFIINHLFDDSKLFLREAKNFEGTDPAKARTYIRASIITGFAALEALVNTFLYLLGCRLIEFRISKGTLVMPTANRMRECRTREASAIDAALGGAGGGTF